MASFSDVRCVADGVCPNDSLVFTCKISNVSALRIILPSGDQEVVSLGDTASSVGLPAGFTADSLVITETDNYRRNIALTISIEKASLLNGSQIKCDDVSRNDNISAMTGCPLAGEPSVYTMH